jgi:ABC transporter DrrB family efflux protein
MSSWRSPAGTFVMADRRSLSPLLELTRARLLEFSREPEVIFWVFAFPVLMTVALGVAFRERPAAAVPVGVVAMAGSEAIDRALSAAGGLTPQRVEPGDIERAVRDGAVHVVVQPGPPPTYYMDPARPESEVARLRVDAALQRAAGRVDVWQPREERVATVGSRYIDWLVPGLIGMNIMGTGMWGIGFGVVTARSQKLLKRLMATPMRRSHYLLAQMLARLVFLAAEVGLVLGFAYLVFSVPVTGALVDLAVLAVIGALAFAGLGLLVASRARTVEAVSGLMNLTMVPMWLLSGVFFASGNFPAALQPVIQVLPLTALNDALRDVMLDGRTLAGIAPDLAILSVWAGVTFVAALRLFRWQ